ncbi:Fic family protein [soil metagenome]
MYSYEKRITKLPSSVYRLINQIDELKGHWIGGANLNPQILDRLQRSVLITSTGASTRIEGSNLSDVEIEKLMRGLSMQKFTSRDAQEVRGYYGVLKLVFDSAKDMTFSENLVLHLHSELLQYTEKDQRHRGAYKKLENRVVASDPSGKVVSTIFETTAAYLTPKETQELIDWTVKALQTNEHDRLLVIANFVVGFLKIHPFLDGNGRLSRVLTNLLMIQAGYDYMSYVSHEKLIENTKTDYYIALRRSQSTFGTKEESIEAWATYFLKILLEQVRQAVDLLSAENIEKLLSPNQLKVWAYLDSVEEATPGQIASSSGVARPTVSQAIDRLMRLKRIERIGQGRTTRYRKL